MPRYLVLTPLRNGGPEPAAIGKPVELDAIEGAALAAIGALEPLDDDTVAPPPPPPPPAQPKPLSKMNRAELAIAAHDAGVTIADGMTNKQIVAAIEAKRAASTGDNAA